MSSSAGGWLSKEAPRLTTQAHEASRRKCTAGSVTWWIFSSKDQYSESKKLRTMNLDAKGASVHRRSTTNHPWSWYDPSFMRTDPRGLIHKPANSSTQPSGQAVTAVPKLKMGR